MCGRRRLAAACTSSPSRGVDLLVLGSSRRGLLGRVLVGDHTRAALNGSPCAVAVAPAGYSDYSGNIRRIGVGYDGSLESDHALEVARELAAANAAELSACTAVSVPLSGFGPGALPLSDAIDTLLDNARERIAVLGGVAPHAVYGATVEVLAGYSASLDLLVVGSRAYGPVGRLVHGSTSDELAHEPHAAHCWSCRGRPAVPRRQATRKTGGQPTRWSSAEYPAATGVTPKSAESLAHEARMEAERLRLNVG